MSYFNEDQRSYMEYLATVPPEKKSYCGWYVGECPHPECKGKGTNADKRKAEGHIPEEGK